MDKSYWLLDLAYPWNGTVQHLHPVLLPGDTDTVLVDCGYPGSLELLEAELSARGASLAQVTKLVLTHQDDDHMGAAAELKERYPALQILASETEAPYISGERKNLRLRQAEEMQEQLPEDQKEFGLQFCRRLRRVPPVAVDRPLHPGEQFGWGGGCEILGTPGHTPGHISIRAQNGEYLIAGDAAVVEDGALAVANPEFCLDLNEAVRSLEQLRAASCRRYLCFHGGAWTGNGEC
ncbi:MAG: MBL fold metallo-hydrolase [Oscillibacter sp.]|nr:MBL fold metallo-hydrolase [uncultured Oscillibacter sp.]MCI8970241.1 MBL fold metallo-hydrolase [Oscillibacter sp.]